MHSLARCSLEAILAQGANTQVAAEESTAEAKKNGRKLDQVIGMLQAKAKERAGPRWAFVDEYAPGAPLQLDPAFYYERATDKVWHRAVDAPVPEGCVACFQARIKSMEGKLYVIMDEGGVEDDRAPLQPIELKHALKECRRFKFMSGVELKSLAKFKR